MKFEISVIIPVYNAIRFVGKAVLSALSQDEVVEVLVIDDGSTDGSYELLQELEKEHHIVKLFIHPKHINKGRSATRNLGIINASGNLIAFLDSDDYFLENRFQNDIHILNKYPDSDGVYNAVGFDFYRDPIADEKEQLQLTTVLKKVEPEELFGLLLEGKLGHLHLNGLILKKSIFEKVGFFNEDLKVSEDTEFIWKIALKGRLVAGIIDRAVAIRGIHEENIFNQIDIYDQYELKFYELLFTWSCSENIDISICERFLERIWIIRYRKKSYNLSQFIYWFQLSFSMPHLLTSREHYFYSPFNKNYGRIVSKLKRKNSN